MITEVDFDAESPQCGATPLPNGKINEPGDVASRALAFAMSVPRAEDYEEFRNALASKAKADLEVMHYLATVGMAEGPRSPDGKIIKEKVLDDLYMAWWAKFGSGPQSKPSPEGPVPLYLNLPPSQPWPVKRLGHIMGPAATAISTMVQTSPTMAAQSILAVASLVASNYADVISGWHSDKVYPLSLFFLTLARSSGRKSSSDELAMMAITTFIKELIFQYEEDKKIWLRHLAAWQGQRKSIMGRKTDTMEDRAAMLDRDTRLQAIGPEPEPPLRPDLITSNPSMEGLLTAWKFAHASLGIFTTEGIQLLGGFAFSADHSDNTIGVLCDAWAAIFKRGHRTKEEYTNLDGRRLSMHLMVQPNIGMEFYGNGRMKEQGFLSRFLVACPEAFDEKPLRIATEEEKTKVQDLSDHLLNILHIEPLFRPGTRNVLEPKKMVNSSVAQDLWGKFYNNIDSQMGKNKVLYSIAEMCGKAGESVQRLAAILTIIDMGGVPQTLEISGYHMANAIHIMNWYIEEVLRLSEGESDSGNTSRKNWGKQADLRPEAQYVLDWMRRHVQKDLDFSLTAFSIMRNCRKIKTKDMAEEIIKVLAEREYIINSGGKITLVPSEIEASAGLGDCAFHRFDPPEQVPPAFPKCEPVGQTHPDEARTGAMDEFDFFNPMMGGSPSEVSVVGHADAAPKEESSKAEQVKAAFAKGKNPFMPGFEQ
jgi:Protein of unknown function (DUF3987)